VEQVTDKGRTARIAQAVVSVCDIAELAMEGAALVDPQTTTALAVARAVVSLVRQVARKFRG